MTEPILPGTPQPGDYDDPSEQARREAEAKSGLREDRLRAVEESILASPFGREWLWGLTQRCCAFEDKISLSASPYEQGFVNGVQSIGIALVRRFAKVHPENFALMIREFDGD